MNLQFKLIYIDWRDHAERGIQFYSGTAIYRKEFDLPTNADSDQQIVIDLGQVYEMARVKLNGKDLGVVWTAPYELELSATLLKKNNNELLIEVANSWENRLIGDSQKPDAKVRNVQWDSGLLGGKPFKTGRYTFTTLNKKMQDLQPSGLIGPVQLKHFKQE